MENNTNKINLVTKISVPETLMSLNVGAPVIIPTEKIKTASIRTAATRLQQAKKGKFYITTDGLTNQTKVIRLK